jgi:hypothetical protein
MTIASRFKSLNYHLSGVEMGIYSMILYFGVQLSPFRRGNGYLFEKLAF